MVVVPSWHAQSGRSRTSDVQLRPRREGREGDPRIAKLS